MKKIKKDKFPKPLSYTKLTPDNHIRKVFAEFNQPENKTLEETDKRFWKWAFMRLNKEYCRDFKRYKAQESELLKTIPKEGIEREIKFAEFIWRVSTHFRKKHGIYKPLDPKNERPFEWNFYSSVPVYLFLPYDNLPSVIKRIAELESDTPSVAKMVPTIVGVYANMDYPKTRVMQELKRAVDLLYKERREAEISYKADKKSVATYKNCLLWWNRYNEYLADNHNLKIKKETHRDKNHFLKIIRHYYPKYIKVGLPHFHEMTQDDDPKALKKLQDNVERWIKMAPRLIKSGYKKMEPAATSGK